MNPIEWLQTMPGKRLMAYVYGWGEMIVIIGAMFKIQHWPGAGPMLVTGLSVEAIIFFLSAFEPPHAETDWSLVWPQLAHGHDDDIDELEEGVPHEVAAVAPAGTGFAMEMDDDTLTAQLDRMLEEAKIGPELIESLSAGLKSLDSTASNLADISDASVATNEYVQNVNSPS